MHTALLPSLCLFVAQAGAPLLPPPPDGWRTERLELPLSFATELPYRGYEDLAFAPGMFTKGSDSYFSYALALRLDGKVSIDAKMLKQFFESYYRGLCRAVGEERKLDRDPSTVRAMVRPDGAGFHATVEMFDPFTDGGPLTLEIEIEQYAAPRATEILGLASPLARDAEVWRALHTIGDAWRAARPAPLYLNHVYAVVDRETYDALARSTFLRDTFAVSEERTTVRTDMSYSGLYFYGRRTYFEFLPPNPSPSLPAGGTGIALGVEVVGGNEALARRLGELEVGASPVPVTRELEGKALPWFGMLGIDSASALFNVFVLEYDPRFLASWHGDLEPKAGGIARSAVLERYAASLGRASLRESMPLADVTSVELALTDAERERLLAVAAAGGYEVEAHGDSCTCYGPQYRLDIARAAGPGGVTGFEVALSRAVEHEPLQLGKLRVTFKGDRAKFTLAR